jgi:hypothetical protein
MRMLPWVSALVLVAGGVAFLIAYFGNTGKTYQVEPTGNTPAQVSKAEPTVKLDPAARKVAGQFLVNALTRTHLQRAWELSHPSFRGAVTHKEWLAGTLPGVTYFPAKAIAGATFKVDESHPRQAYLRVLVLAKKNAGVRSQDFFIGLKAVGTGKDKHWLVNYFAPASGGAIVPNVGE